MRQASLKDFKCNIFFFQGLVGSQGNKMRTTSSIEMEGRVGITVVTPDQESDGEQLGLDWGSNLFTQLRFSKNRTCSSPKPETFSKYYSNRLYIFNFLNIFSVHGPWNRGHSIAMLASFTGGTASSFCCFMLGVHALQVVQQDATDSFSITAFRVLFLSYVSNFLSTLDVMVLHSCVPCQVCCVSPQVRVPLLMSRGYVICLF